ncbi:hypothetical protein J2W51_003900 [Tardiphaga robiniae]|nr:hypothetical protein [Tardiphaga robiniae]MDR6661314.1 hypothetical protein [Tardiphaga robiniae]
MKQTSEPGKAPADQILKSIRRQTRRQYWAQEEIRIVLQGMRGEENVSFVGESQYMSQSD